MTARDDGAGVLFTVIYHLKIPALEEIFLCSPAVEDFRLPDIEHHI